ncbi:MAG: hypothetical protein QNK37_06740 [Acidobacteriota bacterium]|nr:hypothetical protein [Acidobacteriota bacterium]
MTPVEFRKAEQYLCRWRNGDNESWAPLKTLIERRMAERVESVFRHCNAGRRQQIKLELPDHHARLIAEGKLDPLSMVDFKSYCGQALRLITPNLEE